MSESQRRSEQQGAGPPPAAEQVAREAAHEKNQTAAEAREAAEQLKMAAAEAKQTAVHTAETAASEAQRLATEAKDATAQAVAQVTGEVKSQTRHLLHERKLVAAEEVGTLQQVIHQAAGTLRSEGNDNVAAYVDAAAAKLSDVRGYLEERRLEDLLRDTQRFARRRPEVFLGGMMLAGLAAARFLKSSAAPPPHETDLIRRENRPQGLDADGNPTSRGRSRVGEFDTPYGNVGDPRPASSIAGAATVTGDGSVQRHPRTQANVETADHYTTRQGITPPSGSVAHGTGGSGDQHGHEGGQS